MQIRFGKLKADAESPNKKTDEKLKRTSYARNQKYQNITSKLKRKRKRMETIKEKKDSKYLIKWENSPKEENTWELRSAIPLDIIKTYERDLLLKRGNGKLKEIKNDPTEYRSKDKHRNIPLERNIPELKKVKKFISNAQTENNLKVKPVKSTKKGNENSHIQDGDKSEESVHKKDDLYIIESLVKKRGSQYLVKCYNYSEDHNTWEPK